MKQSMRILTSSQTAEWYTPPRYIAAVREVLGEIDLDPASCEAANRWIRANQIFTEVDNGLIQRWTCKTLFLNPPYGKTSNRSNQDIWAQKLIEEYQAGNIREQAILLTKTVPGYDWWERLFERWPVCFCRERIRFLKLNRQGEITAEGQAKAGSSFWYFGRAPNLFGVVFQQFGRVILPFTGYCGSGIGRG